MDEEIREKTAAERAAQQEIVERVDGDWLLAPFVDSAAERERVAQKIREAFASLDARTGRAYAIPPPAPVPAEGGEVGLKYDSGKTPLGQVFRHNILEAVEAMARVIQFGADKYGQDNWELVEGGRRRYLDALVRHVAAFASGVSFDTETGLHHLAHAMTNCAFLIHLDHHDGESERAQDTDAAPPAGEDWRTG